MRILSWNVNRRRDVGAQAAAIASLRPDVVVLQEVTVRSWPLHREALTKAGLAHAISAPDASPRRPEGVRAPSTFVAVASRWPLGRCREARVPTNAAVVCVAVDSPSGAFDLAGVHVPTTGSGDPTLHLGTQEGLLARLARLRCPTLLCGDFNSPLAERADGTVIPFAPRRDGRRYAAETKLMGLTNSRGMADLFRTCHGYGIDAASWWWKNRGRTGGYRLDHMFATAEFRVRSCGYMHEWRTARLSDHSAIYADVVLTQRP